jgi:hypothetical protein
MKLSDKMYKVLKWLCLIVIPAFNGFLTLLNSLWNWGLPIEAITGSVSGASAFIGAIIGISTNKYNKENGNE